MPLKMPRVDFLGKVMGTLSHLRSWFVYCLGGDRWCQEGEGGVRVACEKGRGSFHLPAYFGRQMLIILLSWASKEANFGSLRDSRSASSLPGQELLLWNSSVELAPGGSFSCGRPGSSPEEE